MKLLNNKNKSGYSIIISLLIIWFLLVLTTGIYSLILNELKDNRAIGDYIKAYAWAESARELALLKIKENGYWYYDKIEHNKNDRSIMMSNDSLDSSIFNNAKDVLISYDIWSKVEEYEWQLNPLEHDIVPLFYVNDLWEQKVTSIDFSILSWTDTDLAWNIIWKDIWLSWKWSDTIWVKKVLTSDWFSYGEEDINSFIRDSESNYLHLVNTWNVWIIKYKIKATNEWEEFSKPETDIISSAEIWNYKQNLSTKLDNTEFLDILKYSIYSN